MNGRTQGSLSRGRIAPALVIAATLALGVVANAQDVPAPAPGETWTVSRAAWMGELSTLLPPMLCQHPYFVTCFTTPMDQCQVHAATAVEGCLGMYSSMLPEVFNQPDDGANWGAQVGECAGTRLETAMRPTFTNTPQCNDPSQWL